MKLGQVLLVLALTIAVTACLILFLDRDLLQSKLEWYKRDEFELRHFIKPVKNVKEGHYSGLMVGAVGQPDTPVRYQCSYEGCEFECGK